MGCGTGFPLLELAERLGPDARLHGVDHWGPAMERLEAKNRGVGAGRTDRPAPSLHVESLDLAPASMST